MRIFLNTKMVALKHAVVSVFDHGFLYGDGVFETVRAYSGTIFRLEHHLARLENSARLIQLKIPKSKAHLKKILYRTLTTNQLKNALLRITLSRGPGKIGLDPDLCRRPTLVVSAHPVRPYPVRYYSRGIIAIITSTRHLGPHTPDPRIKSANFLVNILAKIEAKKAGGDEGLILNRGGYLTEGTTSNIFIIKKGRLFTPSPRVGLLEGVTRQAVMEIAEHQNLSVHQSSLIPRDLYDADECFLTNTSLEIMPVRRVDRIEIGGGRPGPITRKLQKSFRALVQEECETPGK